MAIALVGAVVSEAANAVQNVAVIAAKEENVDNSDRNAGAKARRRRDGRNPRSAVPDIAVKTRRGPNMIVAPRKRAQRFVSANGKCVATVAPQAVKCRPPKFDEGATPNAVALCVRKRATSCGMRALLGETPTEKGAATDDARNDAANDRATLIEKGAAMDDAPNGAGNGEATPIVKDVGTAAAPSADGIDKATAIVKEDGMVVARNDVATGVAMLIGTGAARAAEQSVDARPIAMDGETSGR